ncbi:transposase [Streptomyces sp. HD]|uniref:transposase n=1 Tax=Streptomyces sp. HD TaxID=3020892 RepID=UPI00232B41AC|nr:transposase [Streptomyces sp. HD]MDC0773685.1 transposase [Streptomyces sp. HD]
MADDRLTPAEAAERLGISREAMYVLNSRRGNGFPRPVYIGRTPTWTPAQLDTWRASHPPKRPAQRREEGGNPLNGSAARKPHSLRVHLAFAKARGHPILTADLQSLAERAMRAAAQELGVEIEQFRGQTDLVQIAVRYPAHVSIANLAKRLRGAASRAIRLSQDVSANVWSKQYYAASIGAHTPNELSQYVEHLEQPVNN